MVAKVADDLPSYSSLYDSICANMSDRSGITAGLYVVTRADNRTWRKNSNNSLWSSRA